jgi:3-methyladenine DNA glycosylase AlkD
MGYTVEETIRSIRKDLRLSMNGVVTASMREKGMSYGMNFGVKLPDIRRIASHYIPDKELAESLWKQDVRELKIIATMLYPPDEFFREDAARWVIEIPNQEIREQACMNLFSKTDFADELVNGWVNQEEEEMRITGYGLFARLAIIHAPTFERVDKNAVIDRALSDVFSDSLFLFYAALNALKFVGRDSRQLANTILNQLKPLEKSSKGKEIADILRFEFEDIIP